MGRIINFVSTKGGVGKSTLIYFLAHKLSEKNYNVCVVDGYFYYSSFSCYWNNQKDMKSYLLGEQNMFDALNKINQCLYFAKFDSTSFDYYTSMDMIKYFVLKAANNFDFVLIDSNLFDKKSFDMFLIVSSEIFLVTTSDICALKNSAKLLFKIKRYKREISVKIVLNKMKIIGEIEEKILSENEIEKLLKSEILFSIPYLFKHNFFKMGNKRFLNNEIIQNFCYAVITNKSVKNNYQKKYRGLVGFLRRKIYSANHNILIFAIDNGTIYSYNRYHNKQMKDILGVRYEAYKKKWLRGNF